jgi:superfamily I DNA and/or RNA helicase
MDSKLIDYFSSCYQADNAGNSVWNIFAKKVQHLNFLNQGESVGFYNKGSFQLQAKYGNKLTEAVTTYRREKTLQICTHYIVGYVSSNAYGKETLKRICCPLFFIDIEIQVIDGIHTVLGNPQTFNWNHSLLYELIDDRDKAKLIQEGFKYDSHLLDSAYLKTKFKELASVQVFIQNEYQSERQINELQETVKDSSSFYLLPCAAIALLDRSISSRGIIDELNQISKSGDTSSALSSLNIKENKLSHNFSVNSKQANPSNVPGILSQAQKDILAISAKEPLSLLIGPPGTGKSYTIASLALERFMAGESILIVSQNEYAVNVINEKLVNQFGLAQNAIMRAGSKNYHRNLKRYLDQILKGHGVENKPESKRIKLKLLERKISSAEHRFLRRLLKGEKDGKLLYDIESGNEKPGFINNIKMWFSNRRIEKYGLLQRELENIQQLNEEREALLAGHISEIFQRKILNTVKYHRADLIKFREAIGARTSKKQESIFSQINFSVLLNSMPVWLCSLDALHKALPLGSELFDLVIIDEATQCNIASCLPALYRAKRALIVGDPKQLRHVSFLSRDRQERLLEKVGVEDFGISYRDDSMVDLAGKRVHSIEAIVTLDEHYRSVPALIQFSNEYFYNSRLRIMTEKPQNQAQNAIEICKVEDGIRLDGVNKLEAQSLIKKLRALIDEQVVIPDKYKLSIGVLSFFRVQAEYLQELIFDQFDLAEIEKHEIRSGTPYAFQGEERDIMLISCAVDRSSSGSTLAYLNREDMFNVAITRAREKQTLFISMEQGDLPSHNLLSKYLQSINRAYKYNADINHRNKEVQEFAKTFSGQGYAILLNYPIAGIEMDIVLMRDGETLAIDLVGFPGEEGIAFHLDRYKIFERAGLKIIPISFCAWRIRKQEILKSIKHAFVLLKEKNTVSRLTVSDFSHHWTKLLAEHPVLANNVRVIEADLISMKCSKEIEQLGGLVDQYQRVIWVLNEKLNPHELTFARYTSTSEQVLLGGIDNLSQIVMLYKSSSSKNIELSSDREILRHKIIRNIEELQSENNNAILGLEQLALKWSKTKTFRTMAKNDLGSALDELEELSKRVDNYQ